MFISLCHVLHYFLRELSALVSGYELILSIYLFHVYPTLYGEWGMWHSSAYTCITYLNPGYAELCMANTLLESLNYFWCNAFVRLQLSCKNTQSCWLLRANYSLFLPLKAADFTDISPFRSECLEFPPRFDTHRHDHTCKNTCNLGWGWQKNHEHLVRVQWKKGWIRHTC